MLQLVDLQALLPAEALPTHGAEKRPVVQVNHLVLPQLCLAAKSLGATGALVEGLLIMLSLVGQEIPLAVEDQATGPTRVKALGRVVCPVAQQVPLEAEEGAALAAGVPALPSVFLVAQEAAAVPERPPTGRAGQGGFLLRLMKHLVRTQCVPVLKGLPTLITDQHPILQSISPSLPGDLQDTPHVGQLHCTPARANLTKRALWPPGTPLAMGWGWAPASRGLLLHSLCLSAPVPVTWRGGRRRRRCNMHI